MNLFEFLKNRGYATVPASFYDLIGTWKSWYDGDVSTFHRYKVYNGHNLVSCQRYSMGMAKKVSEDWANLLMNERVSITLEGDKEQQFFDDVCQENNFWIKANEMQELKSALGTVAYVPRVINATAREDGTIVKSSDAKIRFDYVTAENIFPLSWENGVVDECAFASSKAIGNENYVYIQIHKRAENGSYQIENVLFRKSGDNLTEVELSSVPTFSSIPRIVNTGSIERQFVIDRLNIANNVDVSIPMGIPAFANAIDQLKGVDVAYDSYVNEFLLGKKRIMVKPEATKDLDGNPAFDSNDMVFYVLPEDSQSGSLIEEIDMSLRTEAHNTGVQDMLNALSSRCGFGENHYRFNGNSIQTATQVISDNSNLFRTIKKHEIVLDSVLRELCRIVLRLGNRFVGSGLDENVEISIDFDDSIIEDKNAEFERDARLLQMGIMKDWEFRSKWMNEDEETAKKSLPGMEPLVNDVV